jgi:hypothetical protein
VDARHRSALRARAGLNSRSDAVIVKEKLDEQLEGHEFADTSASELLGCERRARVSVTGPGPTLQ